MPPIAALWMLALAYLLFVPSTFTSRMTMILPGSGVGGSINVESIGQASSVTSSAFSSATLSPTENYKRLLMADITLRAAARIAGESPEHFPSPTVKLIDQTNLIEISLPGGTPQQAHRRTEALLRAFLSALDGLRSDEARMREMVDRVQIARLQDKAQEAQRRLLQFQGRTKLVSLEQFNTRMAVLDALRDRERIARTQMRQSAAGTARLLGDLGASIDSTRTAMVLRADPIFQNLLSRYAALTTVKAEKGATLGAHHVTMDELSAQTSDLRDTLSRRGAVLAGLSPDAVMRFVDLSVSDQRSSLLGAAVTGDSVTAGSAAAVAEIKDQIGEQSRTTQGLVTDASALADLTRDLRVADAVLSSALARLDTNKSDPFASYPLVQTLEAPSLPAARSSPSVVTALAGALIATVLLLIGFALAWLRQPIIRTLLPKG